MAELDLDQRAITTIRTLAMDAVQAAHSGHPGTPMAMAPAAYWLWHRVLRFDPDAAKKEMLHLISVCYPLS